MTTTVQRNMSAIGERIARAESELAAARIERDAAIRTAHLEGASLRSIARDLGVSVERVRRIVGDSPDMLNIRQAAKLTGLKPSELVKRAFALDVRHVVVDGEVRYNRAELEKL